MFDARVVHAHFASNIQPNYQVAPERRAQLHRATEAQVQLSHRAYQDMQQRYKATRQLLFQFMSECADTEGFFQRNMETASMQLGGKPFSPSSP
jgi:DNA-binding transcriptional regulator YdaS (Cro superfamily)